MIKFHVWRTAAAGIALLSLAAGCANEVVDRTSSGSSSSTSSGVITPPNGSFELDFSAFYSGALPLGSNTNLAFTTDLAHPVRSFDFKYGDLVKSDGLIMSFDYTSSCGGSPSNIKLLEQHVQDLPTGTPTIVSHIDAEILRLQNQSPESLEQAHSLGSVCYGYRKPGGAWYWMTDAIPVTYDRTADKMRVHIDVPKVVLDAIKLVPAENRPFINITYAASPAP